MDYALIYNFLMLLVDPPLASGKRENSLKPPQDIWETSPEKYNLLGSSINYRDLYIIIQLFFLS